MNRPTCILILGVALGAGSIPGMAAEFERGRLLYQNHCIECHTSQVHIRERKRAGNPDELRRWIDRWSSVLDLHWSSQDGDDVQKYLDQTFYRFEASQ